MLSCRSVTIDDYNGRRRHFGRFHQTMHRCRRDKTVGYIWQCVLLFIEYRFKVSVTDIHRRHRANTKHRVSLGIAIIIECKLISSSKLCGRSFFLTTRINTYYQVRNCLSRLRLYGVGNDDTDQIAIRELRYYCRTGFRINIILFQIRVKKTVASFYLVTKTTRFSQ